MEVCLCVCVFVHMYLCVFMSALSRGPLEVFWLMVRNDVRSLLFSVRVNPLCSSKRCRSWTRSNVSAEMLLPFSGRFRWGLFILLKLDLKMPGCFCSILVEAVSVGQHFILLFLCHHINNTGLKLGVGVYFSKNTKSTVNKIKMHIVRTDFFG